MKVSESSYRIPKKNGGHVEVKKKKAPLPLIAEEAEDPKSYEHIQHYLRTVPSDTNLQTYKVNCHVIQGGKDVRVLIRWSKMLSKVF